jgi:hypothetical protein
MRVEQCNDSDSRMLLDECRQSAVGTTNNTSKRASLCGVSCVRCSQHAGLHFRIRAKGVYVAVCIVYHSNDKTHLLEHVCGMKRSMLCCMRSTAADKVWCGHCLVALTCVPRDVLPVFFVLV